MEQDDHRIQTGSDVLLFPTPPLPHWEAKHMITQSIHFFHILIQFPYSVCSQSHFVWLAYRYLST